MARTPGRLAALYGGRHLRTTLALAGTSIVAGSVTGFVGIGVAGTHGAHDAPAPPRQTKPVKHHHPATEAPATVATRHAPRPTHSTSPTPTRTRSVSPKPSATATTAPTSPTPTATPTTQPTGTPASQPASASPPS